MYFPKFNERNIECSKCEKGNCYSREKYQRNTRHFSYQSGRCPRLPDIRGFVIEEERENQRKAYPFVEVMVSEEAIKIMLNIPEAKKKRRVYYRKSCHTWYYTLKDDNGNKMRVAIYIEGCSSWNDIREYSEYIHASHFILNCRICNYEV